MRLPSILVGSWLVVASSLCADAQALQVLRITPSGEDVPPGPQIVIQFDRAVVPIGRMDRGPRDVPAHVEPDPGCRWTWIDPTALACQLDSDHQLAPATRYEVEVRPPLRAIDGATLAAPVRSSFLTQRPDVEQAWFDTWVTPALPVLRVVFNQRIEPGSIASALRFRSGASAAVGVEAQPDPNWETAFLVRPTSDLPVDAEIHFEVGPGLHGLEGPEPSVGERTVVAFRTFGSPRLLGLRCRAPNAEWVLAGSDGPRCDPLGGAALIFSSPVRAGSLRRAFKIEPPLAWAENEEEDEEEGPSHLLRSPAQDEYPVFLPSPLQADTLYRVVASAGLRDEFDRPLAGPLEATFRTDHRRPRLNLLDQVSVLERRVATQAPIALTNVDRVQVDGKVWLGERVTALPHATLTPRGPRDLAYLYPLPVREWLGGTSGAVAGRISFEPFDPSRSTPQWFFAEVTPFQVHIKLGHYNTLVWVTDLSDGAPVVDADIRIVQRVAESLAEPAGSVRTARARTDPRGIAVLDGTATLDPTRKMTGWWTRRDDPHLMVEVLKGDGRALVPLMADFRLRVTGPNGTWIPDEPAPLHGHMIAWGVAAQGLYRVGDTLRYKLWVRNQANDALEAAPPDGWALRVVDPQSKTVYERAGLALSAYGALDGSFEIPRTGAVGWYRFELRASFADKQVWYPLDVLVADFTPAPFRVTTDLDGELFHDGQRVTVTTRAALHAGGPYVDAPVRVVAEVRRSGLAPTDPRAAGFEFDTGENDREVVTETHGSLDGQGQAEHAFDVHAANVLFGTLRVESAVQDDRGRSVASSASVRFAARDRYVGVRHDGWLLRAGQSSEFLAVVVDEHGALVEAVPISFAFERLETTAARVKGAGNAYLTEYSHAWVPAGTCETVSASSPAGCSFTPERPGSYRVRATVEDTQHRPATTTIERWAAGSGYVLWDDSPGSTLQVVPQALTLHVGDTARYLVKNPFPGAMALVTVERYGVLESWLEQLEDSTAVIEFPIKPEHLPGFYLSVVVTSPRVEAPPGDGDVDLGKPAVRMGYVRTEVRDPYKELEVTVMPEAEEVRPRDRIRVDLRVRTHQGSAADAELAIAVLDESVLDLLRGGAGAFDPYAGLYRLDALDVANFNLVKNLVGLRKLETKGANPGGGGGLDPGLRTRFEFVAYWNPALRTDAKGEARIEFDLPDNLTAWRVLAVAATPTDRFGLGQASVRANLPTEVRSALPNQVLAGDRFSARFTVTNRTPSVRSLDVEIRAEGPVRGRSRVERTIQAEPFRRYPVELPVVTTGPGKIRFQVRAGDARDTDAVELSLPVRSATPLETAASYGSTSGSPVEELLAWPKDARPGIGGLSVTISPTVLGALEGAFEYGRDYPYTCWEQQISRAVLAAHYVALRDYVSPTTEWPGAESFVRTTLARAAEFQAPGGGMVFYKPLDAYTSPYLSAYTAWAFGVLAPLGYEPPPGVVEKLHAYLGELLRHDVFPTFYSRGMGSSVRAVALAALARAGKLSAGDVERFRGHIPEMDLFGTSMFLEAAATVPDGARARDEALRVVLSHAVESAGKLTLVERLDDGWSRLLSSELRTACTALSALVAIDEQALRPAGAQETPMKLVRSVTAARGARTHWENTQENTFCVAALAAYVRRYEAEPPNYRVEVRVAGQPIGSVEAHALRDRPESVARPIEKRDLGRSTTVRLEPTGAGRAYYSIRLRWSPTTVTHEPRLAGLEIGREYHVQRGGRWVRLEPRGRVARGELVRVDLYLFAPGPRNFVVVDDAVPGGLEPVNRDLATASEVDAGSVTDEFPPDAFYFRYDDWQSVELTLWSFYHRELRHDAARFYSEYLPAGRYRLSYVAQAIAPGTFAAPAPRAEEMYEPDVFGLGVPDSIEVQETDEP